MGTEKGTAIKKTGAAIDRNAISTHQGREEGTQQDGGRIKERGSPGNGVTPECSALIS